MDTILRLLADLFFAMYRHLKPVRRRRTFSGRKLQLEKECNVWISRITDMRYLNREPEEKTPDLYSLYSELCALRTEVKKNARRNHESLIRYDKTISEFGRKINRFSPDGTGTRGKNPEDILERKKIYLPVVEIYERLIRLRENFSTNDRDSGFFSRLRKPENGLKRSKEGLSILLDNFKSMLEKNNIKKIITVGKSFDPFLMTGIEVEENEIVESNTVIKEFSGGYMLGEHVLKLAEVSVAKRKGWKDGNNFRN